MAKTKITRRKLTEPELEAKRKANKGVFIGGKVEGPPNLPSAIPTPTPSEQKVQSLYGTTNPTQSQILKTTYAAQHGGLEKRGIDPKLLEKQPQVQTVEEARQEEAKTFLEERGFFEEKPPVRTELDIQKEGGVLGKLEEIPVVGRTPRIMGENLIKTGMILYGHEPSIEEEALIQDPESFRELAKRKIQEDTIAEGLSAGERFGAMIESIPIVGSLIGKYASGLIEDPKGNVNTIITQIASERERASVLAEKLATGKISPYVGFDELQNMENNVIRLEQRIKLLIQSSAQLQVDADSVNLIEEQILRAKERIYMGKLAASQGMTIEPTDASWFFSLQELKGGVENG